MGWQAFAPNMISEGQQCKGQERTSGLGWAIPQLSAGIPIIPDKAADQLLLQLTQSRIASQSHWFDRPTVFAIRELLLTFQVPLFRVVHLGRVEQVYRFFCVASLQ